MARGCPTTFLQVQPKHGFPPDTVGRPTSKAATSLYLQATMRELWWATEMYFRPAAQPPAERSSSKPGTVLAAEKRGASIFRRSAGVSEASVSIVVLPGALLTAVAGIVEPMAAANEALGRAAYKYRSLVSDDSGVQMGGGMLLSGEVFDTHASPPQNAVLIGGQAPLKPQEHEHDLALRSTLSRWSRHGTRIIAVGDSMITAFAALGTPDAASVFWSRRTLVEELHPDLEIRETLYTVDRHMITCAGRGGAFDMILSDIHAVHGRATASRVADALLLGHYREGEGAQRSILVGNPTIGNRSVRAVVALIERNLETPLKLGEISSRINVSQRQLERLFHMEYGMSPGRYYLKRRLERAHDLLMFTRLPLHEISLACGFSSLTQFNRRYRNVKGMSPAKMRSTTERHV